MSAASPLPNRPPGTERPLWIAYGCACAVAWLLYVLAGAEFQRGLWQLWQAVYQATLSLWPPMLLGVAVFPWVRRAQAGQAAARCGSRHATPRVRWRLAAAWQACDYGVSWLLYGQVYANVMLMQTVLWRAIWGVIAYAAIRHRVHRVAAGAPCPGRVAGGRAGRVGAGAGGTRGDQREVESALPVQHAELADRAHPQGRASPSWNR